MRVLVPVRCPGTKGLCYAHHVPAMKKTLLFLVCAYAAIAQPVEILWPAGAPGALGSADVDKPSLTIRLADQAKANGTAVIVCPGGGYGALAMDHEGKQIADWLNNLGVSAFILKYRLG